MINQFSFKAVFTAIGGHINKCSREPSAVVKYLSKDKSVFSEITENVGRRRLTVLNEAYTFVYVEISYLVDKNHSLVNLLRPSAAVYMFHDE